MFSVAVGLASGPHITDLQIYDENHPKQQATVLEEYVDADCWKHDKAASDARALAAAAQKLP